MAVIDRPASTATLSAMARSRAEVLTRIREADYRKLLKYSAVSAVAFPFTQVLLLVFTLGFDWSFVAAATCTSRDTSTSGRIPVAWIERPDGV